VAAPVDLTLPDPHDAAVDLFRHHPVPLWVYDRKTLFFLAVNDAAIAHYGYTRDRFLEMRLLDMLVDPPERQLQALLANQGRRTRWRHSGVRRHRKADGSIIHAEITAHDLTFEGRPAVAVAAYDVTARIVAEANARYAEANARDAEAKARESETAAREAEMAARRAEATARAAEATARNAEGTAREAEAAARDAERRLTEAQRLARVGSWQWDMASDTMSWSDQLFAIAGRSVEEGAPSFATQQALYPPDDWNRLVAAVQGTIGSGEPYELQMEMIRHDRTRRVIVCRGAVARDAGGRVSGLYGTVQDITDRHLQDALLHATDEKLRESKLRYRDLVESLDDVVFSVDPSGTIQYVSSAVEQFGYTPDELIGRPFHTILHPDAVETVLGHFRQAVNGLRLRSEFRVLDKSGRAHDVRCSSRAQMKQGATAAISGVLIDITEQRRAQEQLRAAARLEAVGRLAGGVAHDFNNLLVAINGFAELALNDTAEDSPVRDDLMEILKAGNRAASLTSQLLAFSRRQVLRPDSVCLDEVIASMEPMLRRLIGEDIELAIACDDDLPPVRIDSGHLEQVIMNLVVNARDAMPNGGVLRIGASREGFPAADLPPSLSPANVSVITVSDTGHGMDAATQAQIFEPFFTTKPLGQGTGLGLAMVYGFVQQSGGAVSVQSAPGQGATFRIALPQDTGSVPRAIDTAPALNRGSETVLVAEDEETVRMLVRRMLQEAGYRVLLADGAETALNICRVHDGTIDLLLTDVVMPHTSGPVLAERARQLRPKMAVLFMSGYSWNEVYSRGLADSTASLLQKPFSGGALAEAVRHALTEATAA
jgi:PAS domain S-box-containing protein